MEFVCNEKMAMVIDDLGNTHLFHDDNEIGRKVIAMLGKNDVDGVKKLMVDCLIKKLAGDSENKSTFDPLFLEQL